MSSSPPSLRSLPAELHLAISTHLPYPDLLALKHTHPYFYITVPTTVYDRVDWLLDRPRQGLPLPQKKCIMKTDAQFCANKEVRLFMERRRRHLDCKNKECKVVEGMVCGLSKGRKRSEVRKGPRRWMLIGALFVAPLVMLAARMMSGWDLAADVVEAVW